MRSTEHVQQPAAGDPSRDPAGYIRRVHAALGDRDPLEVMAELPAALRALTAGLTDDELREPEAPGKWAAIQVVEHLADHEIVNAFRIRSTIAEDSPSLRGYDQSRWIMRLHYGEAELETVLHEIEVARGRTLRLLRALAPAEFERVGMHAERGPESLRANLMMTAGHDILHRRQLVRIRTAIGAPAPEEAVRRYAPPDPAAPPR